ncbi:MAG: DUF4317 domain-containing protein [Agathobaculum sp.]|jgi:hypothetical protein|uniref:DUF4317 domain-containing protein n=1 Tax=Agathobaculum sp. TaxID=2048138 RepID=UPI003D8ABC35
MNISKNDVLELRRRLKKTECTFGRMCGCYVNSGKQVVLKFGQQFSELEDDEFYKYLEIAKKTLSGTLGSNLLELSFARDEQAKERQQYLLALKSSKLTNDALLDRLYEQVIEQYAYPGNYLILVYHDVYDVMTRTKDNAELDESSEVYEYMLCAVCPVELAKPALGYREEENRIGARERDWVVGLPDLGLVYPAFSGRGSDVNAVMYYVKTGRPSHPEFVEKVLGCTPQQTAAEQKLTFQHVIQDAFGEEEEKAENAFFHIQKTISGMVAEQEEEEDRPPFALTAEVVSDVISEVDMPAPVREQIEKSYAQSFGDMPPAAHNVLDSRLVAEGTQRVHTAELEQKVLDLKQRLAERQEDAEESAGGEARIVLRLPEEKADCVRTELVGGQRCLLIPLESGEAALINGVSRVL